MKKLSAFCAAALFIAPAFSQNATADQNAALKQKTKSVSDVTYPIQIAPADLSPLQTHTFLAKAGSREGGDEVGYTSYDLPTNGSSPQRLLVYDDGVLSSVWTGSTSLTEARPDRGTFYNSYDGGTWGTEPDTRIESYRTGFPAIIKVGDHEMYFAHDGNNKIAIFTNDGPGSTNWTEDANSLTLDGTWPRGASADGSNYVHMIAANNDATNTNDYMLYYRSPDGGATWDIQRLRLPGIDTVSGYNVMGADCYNIIAMGDNVYIVAGNSINDLAVWKSTSNGDIGSWTRTRLFDFPISNFDGNTISDDDGDGIADTIVTHDGTLAFVIDNGGMMHVWAGVTYVLDVTPDDDGWTYFPGVAGLWYWNETFGADSLQYLDFPLVDWDESGDPFDGIGADLPNYGTGFTSMASATVDPSTGNIYVVYTHPVEYTDYFDDPTVETAQSFRDLFGFYTTDGGFSWSAPVNISYVAEQQYENVNPFVWPSTVGDKVHVLWFQDQEPGNSLETEAPDAITTENWIIYRGFDFSRFEPYDPTAEYDYVTDHNAVNFNNMSVDASSYTWNFGDGLTSSSENPVHVYAAVGTYNVCLTAVNVYGDDQTCKSVQITDLSAIQDVDLDAAIQVYPSLTTGIVQVDISTQAGKDIQLNVFNLTGALLSSQIVQAGNTTLDLSDLPAGEYYVQCISHSAAAIKHVSLVQ